MSAVATPETGEPLVHAINVHKSFHNLHVLKGVDLDVYPGEVVCLLGPSGSGKTTFLRCINMLEDIDGGRIFVDGDLMGFDDSGPQLRHLSDSAKSFQRRDIGMVFQRFNLFPHRTVLENVIEAPTKVRKIPKKEAVERAHQLLETVGLADKADNYPSQLSGASSSASPSRGPWPWTRNSCSSMSQPRPSTQNSWARCSRSCENWPSRA